MKAHVEGVVLKSYRKPNKKQFSTMIMQKGKDLSTYVIGTMKKYAEGDKIDGIFDISVFQVNGRALLICHEVEKETIEVEDEDMDL